MEFHAPDITDLLHDPLITVRTTVFGGQDPHNGGPHERKDLKSDPPVIWAPVTTAASPLQEIPMSRHIYSIGDTVVLKDGPVRLARSNGACKVLATLPETGGSRQYRVRFESESFDRCIAETDIDPSRSKASARTTAPANTPTKESTSWLKANSVRTAK